VAVISLVKKRRSAAAPRHHPIEVMVGGRRLDRLVLLLVLARGKRGLELAPMCRNIRTLYNFDPPATEEEIGAAALQYVRKISGFNKPSRANEEAFARAVDAVAMASSQLLAELHTTAHPKDREAERAKARARAAERFAA
jgi:hypothetical protein